MPNSGYSIDLSSGVDEYKVSWEGDGELTDVGKRQHNFLGVSNRIKYKDLLNFTKFDPKEITIHSTDYNMTVQSVLVELMVVYINEEMPDLSSTNK